MPEHMLLVFVVKWKSLMFSKFLTVIQPVVCGFLSNVLHYIAGYVLSKLNLLYCTVCNSVLFMTSTDEQLFLHMKTFSHTQNAFGNVKVPSKNYMHCIS